MNNQKMLDVVTMIADIILPDKCDHESALEIWLRAMKRKAREALESCEREAVGNAAAMREALENAKKAICHHAEHICQSLSWENSNLQSNCADVLCAHRELCEAKTAIKAALSAPARNCDAMSRSMCATQFSTTYECNRDGLCDVQTEREKNIHLYYTELIDWLFAPAAERKGEGDGV